MIRNVLLYLMVLLSLCFQGFSQNTAPSRPKVALVLSGGGADGLSHIGVVRWLEEHRISIDYVAGTSIGALVGALYASGHSAAEIERLALSDRFQTWAKGEIEEEYYFYLKKRPADASWVNLKFSTDTAISRSLPTNLVNSVPIDYGLLELFGRPNAASQGNFDSLMIPFRCVASNITKKRLEVFGGGDLSQALRASMAYPFYLKPININGNVYFDGGLYNNFPIDIADSTFHPDIIIGSTVSENIKDPSEDDLISQLKSLLVNRNRNVTVSCPLIVLTPSLANASLFNFSKVDKYIRAGYEAAESQRTEIFSRLDHRVDTAELSCRRQMFKAKVNRILFESIEIKGINRAQSRYVRKLLVPKGKLVSLERLTPNYYRLVADEKIRQVFPISRMNRKTGFYDLLLVIKKEKDLFLSFGGNFSSRPINAAFIGLQYNYLGVVATTISANSYFGKFYGSYQVKARFDFPSRFPFYVEGSFTRNRFDYFNSATTFFEDVKPSYLIEYESFGDLNLAIPARNKSKIVVGGTYAGLSNNYYQTRNFSSADTADQTDFVNASAYLLFERNTLNKKQYANSGTYFALRARVLQGHEVTTPGSTSSLRDVTENDLAWYQLKATYDSYYKRRGKIRLGVFGEAVVSNQKFFSNYTASILSSPTFTPIPESRTRFIPKFRAHSYVAFGLKNVWNIFTALDLRMEGYVFQPLREIQAGENNRPEYSQFLNKRYFIASGALVYHSPVGPLSLSLNYYDTELKRGRDEGVYSFLLTFGYILFNRRALD
jgi:NTE family protein